MDTSTALELDGYTMTDRKRKGISVLLVDPSSFSRACTQAGLNAAPDFSVTSSPSLDAALDRDAPDIVLLQDHGSEEGHAVLAEQVPTAARRWPDALILVVAPAGDTERLLESLQCGVGSVVTTETSLQAVISTIRLLAADLVVYPREAVAIIRDALFDSSNQESAGGGEEAIDPNRFQHLTPRQQEVMPLLALGLSNREIGSILKISESTVKVHIRAIMTQTGVTNRTHLVAQYMSNKTQP